MSTELFGTGLPGLTDEELFGPFGGIAVAEIGRNRAVQVGSGLNAVNVQARLSDIDAFRFEARTEIDWTVENDSAQPEDLIFQFTINGGELRLFDQSGSFFGPGLLATVGVSIFTLGADVSGFLWWWNVRLLATNRGVVVAEEDIFADPLGLGSPALSAVTVSNSEAVVSIAPFTATVNLGPIVKSQLPVTIEYDMSAAVSGSALNLAGGQATIGDPFNLQGNPGSVLAINGQPPGTVPEPSALALTGLVLITLLRRRAGATRP